jgi:phage FluMu protein Com
MVKKTPQKKTRKPDIPIHKAKISRARDAPVYVEDRTLRCCICNKLFQGAGHNPYGYIRRYVCRFTQQTKSYRFPSSSYGMVTGRCCGKCNTMVMRWRGQDGMP